MLNGVWQGDEDLLDAPPSIVTIDWSDYGEDSNIDEDFFKGHDEHRISDE